MLKDASVLQPSSTSQRTWRRALDPLIRLISAMAAVIGTIPVINMMFELFYATFSPLPTHKGVKFTDLALIGVCN